MLREKPAILRGSTLPLTLGSMHSCESLLRSSHDSVDYRVSDYHRTASVYCSGIRIMGNPSVKALRKRLSGRSCRRFVQDAELNVDGFKTLFSIRRRNRAFIRAIAQFTAIDVRWY